MSTFQKNPWRPLWTGKVSDKGYQYERLAKVQKEDETGLLDELGLVDGNSIEKDGYMYWYNAVNQKFPASGPQVARKKMDGTVTTPKQTSFQQGRYQVQNQPSLPPKISDGEVTFQNDTAASLQALHMKVDKLLEVLTITKTVEYKNANSMKNNHGNEISGSDAASSGLGVVENPVHITDEQTDSEDDQQEDIQ